jgi:hypothetical protein
MEEKKYYDETIQRILSDLPSKAGFREFIRTLIEIDDADEQRKVCAQSSLILSQWPWQERFAGGWSWAYDITKVPGLLELIGHLELRSMDGSNPKDLNKFILSPHIVNLVGLTLMKIEEIPQYFYHLTRSPYLHHLKYLRLQRVELHQLQESLSGDALVNLQELIICDDLFDHDLVLLPQLPILNPVKRFRVSLQYSLTDQFLLDMMQAQCWSRLECFSLSSKTLYKEKVDWMVANWVHPGPQRVCIQGTPAAKNPNPAWAEYGIEWEGERDW